MLLKQMRQSSCQVELHFSRLVQCKLSRHIPILRWLTPTAQFLQILWLIGLNMEVIRAHSLILLLHTCLRHPPKCIRDLRSWVLVLMEHL